MVTIKKFKGIRPRKELVSQVASRPYDVMNREEAKEEANDNPNSFLHIIRSEIDLPDNVDDHDASVYLKARENFQSMLDKGIFQQDETENLYVYELTMNGRTQTGLVTCSSVADYFSDRIKKHEHTRPVKEQDRIDHMKTTKIHAEPLFLAYKEVADVSAIINEVRKGTPEYDFIAIDGVRHRFWVINDSGQVNNLVSLFKTKVSATYIADGHHRAASSAKVGKMLADENPNHTGNEEYNFFLTVLFPSSELQIMDYNRVVADLNGYTPEKFLQKVSVNFEVQLQNSELPKPAKLHEFSMYLEGKWYKLTAKPGTFGNDPIGQLDASILQENLLNPILAIKDPRTDKRIDFVGGIRGLKELERRVNSGEMKVAFALYPVSMEQLILISDTGNVMPPKSTWFEPKLRSGLVVHGF